MGSVEDIGESSPLEAGNPALSLQRPAHWYGLHLGKGRAARCETLVPNAQLNTCFRYQLLAQGGLIALECNSLESCCVLVSPKVNELEAKRRLTVQLQPV